MKLKLCTFAVFAIIAILFAPTNRSNDKVSGYATVKTVSSLPASAVLDDWGTRFASFGVAVGENERRTLIRTTIVQLAMFDAVNAAVNGRFRGFASKPESAPDASPEAAAIRAAYIVALHEFQTPTATAMIESAYSDSIASVVASHDAIGHGIEVGEAAANNVIDARKDDHRNDPELTGYPGSGPGVWVPTPNGTINPQSPFLQFVTPFGYDEPSRFRPAPPPALESKTYTSDYNEIKDLGRSSETSRTAEQSATAQFWSPSATALWIANVRTLASSMDLLTAARFEAIGIACATNGLLAAWDGKYTYMFWRPVTAIRAGDIDDNPDTQADPSWTPFIVTPSHPEYPAAHTMVGAAALGFYTVWFGTDQFPLAFKGNGAI